MRYAKLSCTKFYFVIYSNATQLTYSLTRTPGHRQKFSWNWLLSFFFGTQHGVRDPCGVVYDSQIF